MTWSNSMNTPPASNELPLRAAQTTPENPWPVSMLSQKFHYAVEKWPAAWVEGQIVEINARRAGSAYITLRDNTQDVSMSLTLFGPVASKAAAFRQGDRVVVHGKADLWAKATRLSFRCDDIRRVGQGDLKAQIDELRKKLKGEGLFDEDIKQALPQFPSTIGLICAPKARAEGDVITNVMLRWPTVNFKVVYAHVQGAQCPSDIIQAIHTLDVDPTVDVIIVARGGGSFEDLIGFSDEGVVRATAACETPIISAIGHEDDWTLIDLAADVRASTPTDAAKKVVPDVHEQWQLVNDAIDSARVYMHSFVTNELRHLEAYANRPSLTKPSTMLEPHQRCIDEAVRSMRIDLRRIIDDAQFTIERSAATLKALSPQSTLDRGYAVVQNAQGTVLDNASAVHVGDQLTITLKRGDIVAQAQHIDA